MVAASTTEGVNAWDTLQAELRDSESELARCRDAASGLDTQAQDLLARRGQILVQLAQMYLPEITRPAIEKTFAELRSSLLEILARKETRSRELQTELDASQIQVRDRTASLDEVTRQLNEKVTLREQLEARVAESLKTNDDFQQRSKLALQAEEQLHRNEERVVDIEKDAAEKLPHYERSALFLYLFRRGFGTLEYTSTGWTRSIDAWVARLIDFGNARKGYEFLKKTPKLVSDEVIRRRDLFTQLMQQVEALEHAEAEKIGLTTVLKDGEALGARRDGLVHEIDDLKQKGNETQQSLADLARSQNQFYSEAIERFRTFLGETKLALLQQRARETPEPEDDAIVTQLGEIDAKTQEISAQLSQQTDQRQSAERYHEGLDALARRYRQANFDSQRSYFAPGFDIRRPLNRFRDGMIDADRLWQVIRDSQRFRPHWVESAVEQGAQVINSPSSRVLMGAILNAATSAMQQSAYRGIQRRSSEMFPGSSGPVSSPAPRQRAEPRSSEDGSFTSGQGF